VHFDHLFGGVCGEFSKIAPFDSARFQDGMSIPGLVYDCPSRKQQRSHFSVSHVREKKTDKKVIRTVAMAPRLSSG